MPSSVSIRVYKLFLQRKGSRKAVAFNADAGGIPLPAFISQFVTDYSTTTTQDSELERSWNFEPRISGGSGNSKGFIRYGTFGFASDLVDTKTRKSNYKRKVTDSEILPLYYEFWHPSKTDYLLVAFQSFGGKSCVQLVLSKINEKLHKTNPGYAVGYKKLLPNDRSGSIYRGYPVQRVTLIKNNVPHDIADRYSGTRPTDPVNLEVSLVARRKGIIGLFEDVARLVKSDETGIVMHDGIAFDEAVANVRIGGRTRSVGVFGSSSEAGVIDLSNAIKRGSDGHPTLESIAAETDAILKDFKKMLDGAQ